MRKSIIKYCATALLVISSLNADTYNNQPSDSEALAFKRGFNLCQSSLIDGREFRIQGTKEEEIVFKEFMVMIDTTDLDDADRGAIQKIGFIYADSVRLNDERIVMAHFERKANAVSLAKNLNNLYFSKNAPDRKAYTYSKLPNEYFFKEKSFFYEIANIIEQSLKSKMEVVYIKDGIGTKKEDATPSQIKKSSTHTTDKKARPEALINSIKIENIQTPIPEKIISAVKSKKIKSKSFFNKEPFAAQYIHIGKNIIIYSLAKNTNKTDISSKDMIPATAIENNGDVFFTDAFLITTDKVKFLMSESGKYARFTDVEILDEYTLK